MSARRWLAGGDWAAARLAGTAVESDTLILDTSGGRYLRHGVAVLRAGAPDAAQVDTTTAVRWRRVRVRLADPVAGTAWLRVWTLVASGAAAPLDPDPATSDGDRSPVPTPAGRWRAAAVDALDVRVLCLDHGPLWVALELGGTGVSTPRVVDVEVQTGDQGPVTALPTAYRTSTIGPTGTDDDVDAGDGMLGRYLGLLGAELELTSAIIEELPALLSVAVTADRPDSPWLTRLATWVALDPARLPTDSDARRETVATAVERHGWRGTRRGLLDQVIRETGLAVDVIEPLENAAVWRLDAAAPDTSALGLTTGLAPADPGPPVLDTTAWLDASALVPPEDAGLPVHAPLAHRICVHVPGGTADDVAAVDAVVQRERPAHVLARTCATARVTTIPTEVGVDTLPDRRPTGLPSEAPLGGVLLGDHRLPATHPIEGADR
jgi:phage tail-like protein